MIKSGGATSKHGKLQKKSSVLSIGQNSISKKESSICSDSKSGSNAEIIENEEDDEDQPVSFKKRLRLVEVLEI